MSIAYFDDEKNITGDEFESIELNMYTELEEGDSFYILLRKKEQTKPSSDQVAKENEL